MTQPAEQHPFTCTHCHSGFTARVTQCPKCNRYNAVRPTGEIIQPGNIWGGGDMPPRFRPDTPLAGPRILNTKTTVLDPSEAFIHTPSGVEPFDIATRGGLVLGKSGVGTTAVLYGTAGAGKTTMLLGVLAGYAKPDHPCVYFTAEQEGRIVLATAKMFGFESEYLSIVEAPRGLENVISFCDRILLQLGAKMAVYDSLQTMKVMPNDILRPLTRIFVSRLNKFGEIYGEREQEHDPDTLISCGPCDHPAFEDARDVETTKNRHGQLAKAFYWLQDEKIWTEKEIAVREAAKAKPKRSKR